MGERNLEEAFSLLSHEPLCLGVTFTSEGAVTGVPGAPWAPAIQGCLCHLQQWLSTWKEPERTSCFHSSGLADLPLMDKWTPTLFTNNEEITTTQAALSTSKWLWLFNVLYNASSTWLLKELSSWSSTWLFSCLKSTQTSIPFPLSFSCLSCHTGGKEGDKLIPFLKWW